MIRSHPLPVSIAAAVALALCATPGVAALTPAAPPAALAASAPTGVDVSRDAVATASSVELDQDRFAATLVNDGDSSTRWSSKYVDDSWLQLALAKPSPVYSVEIDWPNACARAFSLQTSVDGTTWKTVAARTGQTTCPRTDEIVIDADEPVSFVRMLGAQRWSQYGYSISEMRVWNGPKPEPVPELPLVPQPVDVQRADGEFTLPPNARIEASRDAKDAAKALRAVLRPSTGYTLPVTAMKDRVESAIEIEVADGLAPAGHAAEGYVLNVDADGIRIGADTAAGALNGVQTLRQLLPAWAEDLSLDDEISALGGVAGMSLNWGRSAIEVRDADAVAGQIARTRDAGVLRGLMFSGASATDNAYGPAWEDNHPPFAEVEPSSLLTEDLAREALAAAGPLDLVGVKMGFRPLDAPLEAKLDMIGHAVRTVTTARG